MRIHRSHSLTEYFSLDFTKKKILVVIHLNHNHLPLAKSVSTKSFKYFMLIGVASAKRLL